MTQTLPDVDTTELDAMDFTPQCDVVEVRMPGHIPVRCERPATMQGLTPCCGSSVLACKDHVADGRWWHCTECNSSFPGDKMHWTPL